MRPGHTVIIPNTGGEWYRSSGEHLFVCISYPDTLGNVLLVPVGSIKWSQASPCRFAAREHPWFKRPSHALYWHTTKMPEREIAAKVVSGEFKRFDDFSPALTKRMIAGLFECKDAPDFAIKLAKAQGIRHFFKDVE